MIPGGALTPQNLKKLREMKNRGLQDILIACVDGLKGFPDAINSVYPQISKSWRTHWESLNTLFGYPPDIRRAIYTTNAIDSLNSVIRAAIKKRKGYTELLTGSGNYTQAAIRPLSGP